MRNILIAAASTLAMISAAPVLAASKTLILGGYGGSFETLMKEDVIPSFEKAHGVDVQFVPGNSTENLARLQAQRGNQELDVVFLDDGPMYQAVALGFCDTIADAPVLDDVYDIARMGTDKAIGTGFVATGFAYNTEMFEKKGWEPPSSWMELTDPKYKGLLSIPPITNTYGLHTLVMLARLNGGGEKNIEPGFRIMSEEVAPNVLVFEPSSGRMSQLFQSESIALSIWGSGRVKSLADTGFPVRFAYPEEGAIALMVSVCPVVNSNVPDLSQKFIQYVLSPEVQVKIATTMGQGPTGGAIRIDGRDMARVAPGQRGIGIVFQSYALFMHMTVAENVSFGLEMRKVPKPERQRRVMAALALVQLDHLADRYPRAMSGGQQQRVALARALVIEPQLLLLDEPLSNLDAKLREEMQIELRNIQQRAGVTTVLVTHDQTEAMALSDRVAVMERGNIVQVSTPFDAYEHPANGFVAGFLGKTNHIAGRIEGEAEGHVRVATEAGVFSAPTVAGLDGAVVLSIRPEKIRFVPMGEAMLAGRVAAGVFLGNQWLFQVESPAGRMLVVHQNAGRAAATAGEEIGLAWDADQVRVLAHE